MREEMASLLERYWGWLKSETTWQPVDGGYVITTPSIDRHNDYTQLYVRPEGEGFRLSDAGYILDDLEMSGFVWDTPRRREILSQTAWGFGVELVENRRLETKAGPDNFPVELHSLLQAMLAVNDMFFLAQDSPDRLPEDTVDLRDWLPSRPSAPKPRFQMEVADWLNSYGIYYRPAVTIEGSSGSRHSFPFTIPASETQPERLLRPVSRAPQSKAWAVFAGRDTLAMRPYNTRLYAFVDDHNGLPSTYRNVYGAIKEVLEGYDLVVPWSERDSVREELTA